MKISIADLKKAINWIEANSPDMLVNIDLSEGSKLYLSCTDKYECEVEISLYRDNNMMPKIKKTDVLR